MLIDGKKINRKGSAFQLRSTNAKDHRNKTGKAVRAAFQARFCRLSTMLVIRLFPKNDDGKYL